MSAFTGVNDPGNVNGRNRSGSFASDPGMSRSSSTTSLANLEKLQGNLKKTQANYEKLESALKEFAKGGITNAERKARANKTRAAYQKHFKAAQNRWLSSHGMPKAVNKGELARLNKESKEYAMRLYGRNAAHNAGLSGGKRRRNTRRNRKANRKTRKN